MAEQRRSSALVIIEDEDNIKLVDERESVTIIDNSEGLAVKEEDGQTTVVNSGCAQGVESENGHTHAENQKNNKSHLKEQTTTGEEGSVIDDGDANDSDRRSAQVEKTEHGLSVDINTKGQIKEEMSKEDIQNKDTHLETDMVSPTNLQGDTSLLSPLDQLPGHTLSLEDVQKQARRLTPDFPEALYELLCTLQEGRRLNDQRCSFRNESGTRRRCHSVPCVTVPGRKVVFSSMTSLQKEEFFELVATSQNRRLNDQRAPLQTQQSTKPKVRKIRSSLKLSIKKAPPVRVPKDDLYSMILTSQAQGRLEEQRSKAPGPMDDEDFFSLLLKVQGGRMEEQRTELPGAIGT